MGIPTLPNGQPVNFGFGNKSHSQNKSQQKNRLHSSNEQGNQRVKNSSSSHRKNKSMPHDHKKHGNNNNISGSNGNVNNINHNKSNSNNSNSKSSSSGNNKSSSSGNNKNNNNNSNSNHSKSSKKQSHDTTASTQEKKEGASYAGSSFHVSQPKLSDLPKPSFNNKPSNDNTPGTGTKLTVNELFGSNSNGNTNSGQTPPSGGAAPVHPGNYCSQPPAPYNPGYNYNYPQYTLQQAPPSFPYMNPFPPSVPGNNSLPYYSQKINQALPSYPVPGAVPIYQNGFPGPLQGAFPGALPANGHSANLGANVQISQGDHKNQEIVQDLKKHLKIT